MFLPRVGAVMVAALFLPHSLVPQGSAPDQRVTVVGQVTEGPSGVGIAQAKVTLVVGQSFRRSVLTASNGEFVFLGAPTGPAGLVAEKAGFSGGTFGDLGPPSPCRSPQGGTFTLDRSSPSVKLLLFRNGILSGRVVDEFGDGIAGLTVAALAYAPIAGRPRLVGGPTTTTDDRGSFRISVSPGRYAVGTGMRPRVPYVEQGYQFFFPNGVRPTPVPIQPGEERGGLEIVFSHTNVASVSGAVRSNAPLPPRTVLELVAERDDLLGERTVATTPIIDGRFNFPIVPFGRYLARLVVYPRTGVGSEGLRIVQHVGGEVGPLAVLGTAPLAPIPSDPSLGAVVPVEVRVQSLDDLLIDVSILGHISGSVVWRGAPTPSERERVRNLAVTVMPASGWGLGTAPAGAVNAAGSFRTIGFPPDKYILAVAGLTKALPGWNVVSVMVRGAEVVNRPFELGLEAVTDARITLAKTSLSGTVHGRIVSEDGAAAAEVFAFPVDRAAWVDFGLMPPEMARVRADERGTFSFELPAGEYFLTARRDDIGACWKQPEILQALASTSERVRVRPGESVAKQLPVK